MEACEYYQQLMSQSLDGALSPREQQTLEGHLAQCAQCRSLYRQLQQIHSALSEWEEQPVPDGFTQGVMARVRALEQQPAPANVIPLHRRPAFRALGSLAACAVLCLGLWRMATAGESSGAGAPAASTQTQTKIAQPAADADISPMMLTESDALLPAAADSDLLTQAAQALGTQPGFLLVLEEIPAQLNGIWYSTADGRAFLLVDTEEPETLAAQLSPDALLSLELGSGPLVLFSAA